MGLSDLPAWGRSLFSGPGFRSGAASAPRGAPARGAQPSRGAGFAPLVHREVGTTVHSGCWVACVLSP